MKFWRSELGLGLGVGTFEAWDQVVVDIGRFTVTSNILEKVAGFDLRMAAIRSNKVLYPGQHSWPEGGGVSLTTRYSEIINGYFHVLPELKRIWFC